MKNTNLYFKITEIDKKLQLWGGTQSRPGTLCTHNSCIRSIEMLEIMTTDAFQVGGSVSKQKH